MIVLRTRRFLLAACAVIFASTSVLAQIPEAKPRPVSFVRDIRPILSKSCFPCHGPDESQRKAKLRLDTREGAFARREGGDTLAPGKPDDSELYLRITSDDPLMRMPPGKDDKQLPPEQVAFPALDRRGRSGYWAFEKPPSDTSGGEGRVMAQEPDRPILSPRAGLDLRRRPSPYADPSGQP